MDFIPGVDGISLINTEDFVLLAPEDGEFLTNYLATSGQIVETPATLQTLAVPEVLEEGSAITGSIAAEGTTEVVTEAAATGVVEGATEAAAISAAALAGGVAAVVLIAAQIFKAIQHARLMKAQANNLKRINDINNQIRSLESQQKVLSNNLINNLNQASRVLNSKAINVSFTNKTLQNIIPYNNPQLPKIGDSTSYTIKKGDNLSAIAQRYGTTWKQLWAMNSNTLQSGNANRIYPGEIIQLPQNAQRDVRASNTVVNQPNNNGKISHVQNSQINYTSNIDNLRTYKNPLDSFSRDLLNKINLIDQEDKLTKLARKLGWSENGNSNLKGKLWRVYAIQAPFYASGGISRYNSLIPTEQKGEYVSQVDKEKFLSNGFKDVTEVNYNNQFLINETLYTNQLDLVNELLGNFIYGKGPENIIFPHNGKFASILKNSILTNQIYLNYLITKQTSVYTLEMKFRQLTTVLDHTDNIFSAKSGVFANIENFLGSVYVKVTNAPNGELNVEIFNITSLTSGDYLKDIIDIPPLESTTRSNIKNSKQVGYSNQSQYFSFTLSKEDMDRILFESMVANRGKLGINYLLNPLKK